MILGCQGYFRYIHISMRLNHYTVTTGGTHAETYTPITFKNYKPLLYGMITI